MTSSISKGLAKVEKIDKIKREVKNHPKKFSIGTFCANETQELARKRTNEEIVLFIIGIVLSVSEMSNRIASNCLFANNS